jgi:hypothetical protein
MALTGVHDPVVDGHKRICEVDTAHFGTLMERLTAVGVGTLLSAPPTLEKLFPWPLGPERGAAGLSTASGLAWRTGRRDRDEQGRPGGYQAAGS